MLQVGRRHPVVLAHKFVGTADVIPSCRRTRPEVVWDELDSATPFELLVLRQIIDTTVSRLANQCGDLVDLPYSRYANLESSGLT